MKKTVLFIVSLLVSTCSFAQNTLIYEISGQDLKSPSYLVGTMHALCEEDFEIKDKVWNALDKAQKVVFEIDYTNPSEMQDMMSMMQSSEPLTNKLTETQKANLSANLALYDKTLAEVDNLTISSVYMLLIQNAIQCTPDKLKMYEVELLKVAMTKQKTFGGLETVKHQFATLEKTYDIDETIKGLALKNEYREIFEKMVTYFKTENIEELDKLLRDPRFMNSEQEHHMLTVRNRNWVEIMPSMMKEESVLFAVGAGHLAGQDGVINLLKQKGYTVKTIM